MQLDIKEYLKFITALVASIGGTAVVILALSKWFGDFLAKTLFEKYKSEKTHELEQFKSDKTKELETLKSEKTSELESIKTKYQKELEQTKSDLDKAKAQFLRYSEKQFDLYNSLWKVLLYTKNQADSLWEEANPDKIPAFAEQIMMCKNAINDNMILIEEAHYDKLIALIRQFEDFQFGKKKLVEFRHRKPNDDAFNISFAEMKQTIEVNRRIKDNYNDIIMEIGRAFRNQIKG